MNKKTKFHSNPKKGNFYEGGIKPTGLREAPVEELKYFSFRCPHREFRHGPYIIKGKVYGKPRFDCALLQKNITNSLCTVCSFEEQRLRNYKIINSLETKTNKRLSHSSSNWIRIAFAVYRLHHYLDETPQNIFERSNWLSETTIRGMIGEVFSILCLSDQKCPFKDILSSNNSV